MVNGKSYLHIKKNILHVFAVIVIIANSGYYRATVSDSYLPLIFLIIITAVLCFSGYGKSDTKHRLNLYLIVLAVGIIFSAMFNFSLNNILSGGRVAVTMLCSYLILINTDTEDIFRIYNQMIRMFILLSFVLRIVILLGYTNFPVLGAYYDLIIISFKVNGTRALGPFWEPGAFATAIIFAFIIETYFMKSKISLFKAAWYFIGVLLAQSTAGIIIFIFAFFAYLMKVTKLEKYKTVNILFIVTLCVGFAFYKEIFQLLNQINPQMFGKLVATALDSTSTRINAPIVNLQIFLEHPLFGYGFTDAAAEFTKYMGSAGGMHIVAQTSTSTQIMSAIGISGIAYTASVLAFAYAKKDIRYSLISKVVIIASMLLIINKEPHIHNAMTWFLIFYMSLPSKTSDNSFLQTTEEETLTD